MMTNEARNPVKGVQTSLDIIDALQEHDRVGVTALANELGISKGTVHCHLATLRQNGYVVKDAGKYRLGLRFIDVAHRVRDRHALYDLVTDEVDELAKKAANWRCSPSKNSTRVSVSTRRAASRPCARNSTSVIATISITPPWARQFSRTNPSPN
ncbi:helix-turn-helix domain-containing protein [Haladaptatus sp. GCM10025893]|uniref:helix-turn-helix domain-containing protein n=1 Tax=Haladaptatus sp. GCM10025893 TaxID=3252659 RepID=UPI00362300FB